MEARPAPSRTARPHRRRARFRSRPRFLIAAAIGVVVAVAIPGIHNPSLSAVIGWDTGAAVFLALLLAMMARATPASMRRRALAEDEARWAFLALMAGAAFFGLFAILGIMPEAKKAGGLTMLGLSLLSAMTILLSWFVVHLNFAVHYAHEFFYEVEHREDPGLDFPGVADERGELDYWDFCYFSFVVGMTAQVSDVQVRTRHWRRMVLAHGILSFLFNAAILGLSINLLAGFF
ncbi:MAG: DUF1345 domain-containing protein [Alphaproteobacteria bacterium]|nr:MAG: DUF1345 domain-containing protein [Alphaproteobacteria bacterium]